VVPDTGQVTEANAYEKLSEQLAAVARLNQSGPSMEPGRIYGGLPGASLPGKLEHWLEKVTENMKKITAKMPDVENWSIEVGLPAGVSITVTFMASDS
jgi:hypothetical protein